MRGFLFYLCPVIRLIVVLFNVKRFDGYLRCDPCTFSISVYSSFKSVPSFSGVYFSFTSWLPPFPRYASVFYWWFKHFSWNILLSEVVVHAVFPVSYLLFMISFLLSLASTSLRLDCFRSFLATLLAFMSDASSSQGALP